MDMSTLLETQVDNLVSVQNSDKNIIYNARWVVSCEFGTKRGYNIASSSSIIEIPYFAALSKFIRKVSREYSCKILRMVGAIE